MLLHRAPLDLLTASKKGCASDRNGPFSPSLEESLLTFVLTVAPLSVRAPNDPFRALPALVAERSPQPLCTESLPPVGRGLEREPL